jgi:hypothetical protein
MNGGEEEKEEEEGSFSHHDACDASGNPLFEMKGSSKLHWRFVRLVAKKKDDEDNTNRKTIQSKDAIKAYCLLCRKDITYTKGNGNSVYRHVENNHKRKLDELMIKTNESDEATQSKTKKFKTTGLLPEFFSTMIKDDDQNMLKKASKDDDQLHGEALLVKWISENLRPFEIVEDPGFVDLCDFLCRLRGQQFIVPSRNKTRNQMMSLAECVMKTVKCDLAKEMDCFSLTTNIWSSRVMQSFLALTLHYVTDDFEMKTRVLEVKPLLGSHTANFIKTTLMESMQPFGLEAAKLSMLLRDNASSNGVLKACNDMQIKHFGCIGHGLHLVIGPFLLEKKKRKSEMDLDAGEPASGAADIDDDSDDSDIAEYQFLDDEEPTPDEIVATVCETVTKFRTVAKYVKNSPKAKEKLVQFGGSTRATNNRDTVTVVLDVRTRWNSALDMLMSMLKLKPAFVTFMLHLETSDGKREFNRKGLPKISEREWIFIEGLCWILTPFKNVTSFLSGDEYPTFTQALPLLQRLKTFLMSAADGGDLFTKDSSCKPIADYVKQNEDFDDFDDVVRDLKACCVTMLSQFKKRFVGLSIEILWVTFLDPRCRKMKHLTENEYDTAKGKLVDEVVKLTAAIAESRKATSIPVSDSRNIDTDNNDPFFGSSLFDSPSMSAHENDSAGSTEAENKEILDRSAVLTEVENYLDPQVHVQPTVSPLVWWREHRFQYPRIAVAARKWLCVPATSSTPSERVFSHCGVALTAKRASRPMRGDALMNQVLLKNNLKHVNLSLSDIKKALLKGTN